MIRTVLIPKQYCSRYNGLKQAVADLPSEKARPIMDQLIHN